MPTRTSTNLFRVAALAVLMFCAGVYSLAQDVVNPTTNASFLTTGTVAAARGGAGTVNGALAGNGSGAVSQAACASLSDGTTNCSAAVGQLPGTTTNDAAAAGKVGEVKSSIAHGGSTSGTAIISVAAPGIVTWSAHGAGIASVVTFTGAGLPTNATAATNFYVCGGATYLANSFAFATTVDNALAGTCVTTTGSTSGSQTVANSAILVSGSESNITGLSLTAGDWNLYGQAGYLTAASTSITQLWAAVSTVSGTAPAGVAQGQPRTTIPMAAIVPGVITLDVPLPTGYVSLSGTTTYYFLGRAVFSASTLNGDGIFWARRAR